MHRFNGMRNEEVIEILVKEEVAKIKEDVKKELIENFESEIVEKLNSDKREKKKESLLNYLDTIRKSIVESDIEDWNCNVHTPVTRGSYDNEFESTGEVEIELTYRRKCD